MRHFSWKQKAHGAATAFQKTIVRYHVGRNKNILVPSPSYGPSILITLRYYLVVSIKEISDRVLIDMS